MALETKKKPKNRKSICHQFSNELPQAHFTINPGNVDSNRLSPWKSTDITDSKFQ